MTRLPASTDTIMVIQNLRLEVGGLKGVIAKLNARIKRKNELLRLVTAERDTARALLEAHRSALRGIITRE